MRVGGDHLLEKWFRTHPEDRAHWNLHFKLQRDHESCPPSDGCAPPAWTGLPQLWSVLKGEMSLVGPRPLTDDHAEQFSSEFGRCAHG